MKRKTCLFILFLLSVLGVAAIINLTITTTYEYVYLSGWATSGVDWLPFALTPALYLVVAVPGAVCSGICGFNVRIKWVKIVSFVMFGIFLLILLLVVAVRFRWVDMWQIFKWLSTFIG